MLNFVFRFLSNLKVKENNVSAKKKKSLSKNILNLEELNYVIIIILDMVDLFCGF